MKPLRTFIVIALTCTGCTNHADMILSNRDYAHGDWLLVNANYAEHTLHVIDDEKVLQANRDGIRVLPRGECAGTTCDGFLMLYKDGMLIEQAEYLDRHGLITSPVIERSYRKARQWTIEPSDASDFKTTWDSLAKNKNLYPTLHHRQPSDKDMIEVYRFDAN